MTLSLPLSLSPSLLGREMPSTQKEEEDVGETFEDDGITSSEEVRAFVIVFALCFVFGKRSFFPIGLSLSLFLFVLWCRFETRALVARRLATRRCSHSRARVFVRVYYIFIYSSSDCVSFGCFPFLCL